MAKICMNCKKEINDDIEVCKCGSRFFVSGEKFHFNNIGVICDCGSTEFKSNMHMDFTNKAINVFQCTKCNNTITTESYKSEAEMMYWED